ncbi:MAG TPA: DsbA family protein [Intrasporangium sp.]|uniref:DsbA family protein n=1 Tax=Intrasporangium sp. TaxID=1925024 RepID=UPI002D79C82F|nr:DsbA family protein [Intrasporangium sp.]HET7399686.1 DsbA family protein [Intrasporangium sp.]
MTDAMTGADLHFYFDPVCPFAWMTSKWVRLVAAQRDYSVDWRSISLRLVNADVDYAAHFPPDYEAGHTAGLRLLRVVERTRRQHGASAVGPLYAAMGRRIFDSEPGAPDGPPDQDCRGTAPFLTPILDEAALPASLVEALEDSSLDSAIQAETDRALALAGKDVGTPIIHFRPPQGVAFFGPVISRMPSEESAGELWDHVVGLAGFPGFAELKRSLRELPQLRALGLGDDDIGVEEDWHGGSRRARR